MSSNSPVSQFNSQAPLIVSDLETLRDLGRPKLFRSKQPITLLLPELSAAASEELSARINGYRNECGCSLGAKSMAVGFLLMLLWLWASNGFFTTNSLWRLPLAFVFAFICAGVGKSVGIALALRRLRQELERIYLNLSCLA
jgi:hypothetical protein